MKKTRLILIILVILGSLFILTGCSSYTATSTQQDKQTTIDVGNKL